MFGTYLIFFVAGLGIILAGLRTREEVFRIAAAVSGAVFMIWGFALTPPQFQLFIEILLVGAVFRICMKCINA
jgi:hypothetical protein